MLKKFYEKNLKADFYTENLLAYDWRSLKELGVRIILLDIDNTLAGHGSHQADDYAREVVALLKTFNFDICIISNAMSNRIKNYAEDLGVAYMSNAAKPSASKILEKLEQVQLKPEQAVLVGDQLLTDIWAGNNAKCHTLLVKPRYLEEAFHIKIKRKIERFFIKRYGL